MYRIQGLRMRLGWQRLWTRTLAWDPVCCEECGWRGALRWAFHTYQDDGSGEDVEARDECPECGGELTP